jgi:eukaryotic-like serine/threonine-protein kinase
MNPTEFAGSPPTTLAGIASVAPEQSFAAGVESKVKPGPIDAQRIWAQHPELDKRAVLNLAYDEYCERTERGEDVDPEEFCARFSIYHASLHRLLSAHRFFEEEPRLLEFLPDAWPEPGQDFLGFRLLQELGRGSFARVFLATETCLGERPVVLKMSRELAAAEADALGRLSHPNIVPVHSIQRDPATGLSVICMPYLGSATLEDVLNSCASRGPPPARAGAILEALLAATPADASAAQSTGATPRLWNASYIDAVLRIAVELADALAFVHSRGIFHCDLKPTNILLSPDRHPRILDFNVSSNQPALAILGVGGTLSYMSPEKLRTTFPGGDPAAAVNAHSDLFALGVILYQLLAGQHPFGPISLKLSVHQTRAQLLERQRQGPRSLRRANPRVDKRLARLVERCLANEAADRPQTASELALGLRQCLTPPGRARRWVACLSWRGRGVACVLLLAALVGAAALAARDPYSVRQRRMGLDAYHVGRYAEAVEHFNRAIEADPNLADLVFERACARMRQGDYQLALVDFKKAGEHTQNGQIEAGLGYCYGSLNQFGSAVLHFQAASKAADAPGVVFNDLGFCYMNIGKNKAALEALDAATARNCCDRAVFFNRAEVRLRIAGSRPKTDGRRRDDARLGIADIAKAIELGPAAAELLCAARLYALTGDSASAVDYLKKALDHGLDPKNVPDDSALHEVKSTRDLQGLVSQSSATRPYAKAKQLLDPLPD